MVRGHYLLEQYSQGQMWGLGSSEILVACGPCFLSLALWKTNRNMRKARAIKEWGDLVNLKCSQKHNVDKKTFVMYSYCQIFASFTFMLFLTTNIVLSFHIIFSKPSKKCLMSLYTWLGHLHNLAMRNFRGWLYACFSDPCSFVFCTYIMMTEGFSVHLSSQKKVNRKWKWGV